MNENSLSKNKVISSLAWKFFERGGIQVVQFIISIVIARLLTPEAYGIVAIVTIFTSISNVFVVSGMGTALMQKKNIDDTESSSVFFYSTAVAGVAYILLFIFAPLISGFYQIKELTVVLRIMSLSLFPSALNCVQNAVAAINMEFRKQFISGFSAALISGILGIVSAYLNFGVWALVVQQLSCQIFASMFMWFLLKWRPKAIFSFNKTKNLLKYGVNILGASLIDTIYHNLENLIIGKKFSASILAFYSKGKQFPLIMIDNVDGAINSVMLPVYSKMQENKKRLTSAVRTSVSTSVYIVFPIMIGLACVGEPLISLVLGDAWSECVIYLQIYCLVSALFPLQTTTLQAIKALGYSSVFLRLQTIKRIIGVIVLAITIVCFNNPIAIAISCVIIEIIAIFINFTANKKLLNYSLKEQAVDVLPSLLLSLAMGIIVILIGVLCSSMHDVFVLGIQTISGIAIYIILSYLFHLKVFYEIFNLTKKFFNKQPNRN